MQFTTIGALIFNNQSAPANSPTFTLQRGHFMAERYYFLWYQVVGEKFFNHGAYFLIKPKVLIQLKRRKIWSFMFYLAYFYWDHKNECVVPYMHFESVMRYLRLKLGAQYTWSLPQIQSKYNRCKRQGQ